MVSSLHIVVMLIFVLLILQECVRIYEEKTRCDYCQKTSRRHESHCPRRIVEDD